MPPVNPTGKTWELINEGSGRGSTDNVIGGTPPDPSDPLSLPLINGWDTNVFSFGGGCKVENGLGLDFENTKSFPIGLASDGNLWCLAGRGAAGFDMNVGKLQLPTFSTSTLADELPATTAIEFRANIASASNTQRRTASRSNTSNPRFVYEHNGSLICINYDEYFSLGDPFKDVILVVDDASDIVNSTVTGYKDIDCSWFGMGWMGEIPTEWRSTLGHDQFCGAAHIFSINSRSSKGPSFYGLNLDDVLSAPFRQNVDDPGVIVTERFASYPVIENSVARAVDPNFNKDLSSAIGTSDDWVTDNNNVYNVLTTFNGGFVIPGTRTYLVLGGSSGMITTPVTNLPTRAYYKGAIYGIEGNLITSDSGGYASRYAYDAYPFYMMFDLADFVDVKNGLLQPDKVTPYSWGRIPEDPYFPYLLHPSYNRDRFSAIFSRGTITSILDTANSRILIAQRSGHYGSYPYVNYPVIFSINYDISGL